LRRKSQFSGALTFQLSTTISAPTIPHRQYQNTHFPINTFPSRFLVFFESLISPKFVKIFLATLIVIKARLRVSTVYERVSAARHVSSVFFLFLNIIFKKREIASDDRPVIMMTRIVILKLRKIFMFLFFFFIRKRSKELFLNCESDDLRIDEDIDGAGSHFRSPFSEKIAAQSTCLAWIWTTNLRHCRRCF
jgi:hypothetical protein